MKFILVLDDMAPKDEEMRLVSHKPLRHDVNHRS